MAAKDDDLQELFSALAESSEGRLSFRVTTSTLLAKDFGIELARSSNPVYFFTITETTGEQLNCVAFTLTLDGSKRPATRAEALGKSLAASEGKLFHLNPCLLVYDYAGHRLLGVPAIDLFGAFTAYASDRSLPHSDSSSFSLTPNFERSTVFMYAEVRKPTVWASSTTLENFSPAELIEFLRRVAGNTADQGASIAEIVEAVKNRLNAAPEEEKTTRLTGAALTPATAGTEYVNLEPRDNGVQIEARLWRVILAAIASSAAVILVGPPGTGKSALVRKAVGTISVGRQANGLPGIKSPLWATPDESWTARELIGGETVAEGDIVFRPGWVLRAIAEDRWLVLDEANRGDLDRIFGALLTWLAGGHVAVGVESSAADAKLIELGWTPGPSRVETVEGTGEHRGAIKYLAGENWRLLGTYNAFDSQRVFRIGAALGRRFVRVPIPPISPALFVQVLKGHADDLNDELLQKIGLLYDAHYQEEVTKLGPALFLGMCNYLRSALQAHYSGFPTLESESDATTSLHPEHLSRDLGAEDDDSDAEKTPSGADAILSEAYVLNLGTFLAQLEERDFERLALRIQEASALSQKEVEWISVMIRSLA
ncbi:AAA family ATPase [[Kitasatospora] papulosa]|uniref:AAA family ATPase n=1 Tax=[Kitasatospora] papulosa TaxID=1464011 RepID=UPI003644B337|nr:MoxR-like ATPase [Streptomyces pratensis]